MSELSVGLKEEMDIAYCYSSRLIHELKQKTSHNKKITKSQITTLNNQFNIEYESLSETTTRATTFKNLKMSDKSLPHLQKNDIINNNRNYTVVETSLSTKALSTKELICQKVFEIKQKDCFSSFELFQKENIIINEKSYYFKIIFGEIFKDIIFQDKTFKAIKLAYFMKFRKNKNINMDTKQANYPNIQKNFSNSVEPKIFMRRDFQFYDEKLFKISHNYINFDILSKKLENIYFYPHKYPFQISEEDDSFDFLRCELVSGQYITFGKMYFMDNFILFESEEDPRDKNLKIKDFLFYLISNRIKDNNAISKQKSILIFIEEINEIIQRRTLLSNQ